MIKNHRCLHIIVFLSLVLISNILMFCCPQGTYWSLLAESLFIGLIIAFTTYIFREESADQRVDKLFQKSEKLQVLKDLMLLNIAFWEELSNAGSKIDLGKMTELELDNIMKLAGLKLMLMNSVAIQTQSQEIKVAAKAIHTSFFAFVSDVGEGSQIEENSKQMANGTAKIKGDFKKVLEQIGGLINLTHVQIKEEAKITPT
ncbi:hypothetical protein N8482_00210 [Chitinophagales bacterium]|nr:hypothetical protein [Chitinophagales bacterium]